MIEVAILGSGKIGVAIAKLLEGTSEYHVTVADRDEALMSDLPEGVARSVVDASDPKAVRGFLEGKHAVISACPYFLSVPIAEAARDVGVHYFDLTEDVATTREIRRIADGANTLFAPQCGLAPGFVSIAAYDLARRFETLRRVRMRVGALPLFPSNAMKYNLTWSTAGLINEYCNRCEVIHDGERREALPLEGYEQFSLDGVTYEAFNTSGGLGTLCETLAGKVDNLDYKSIRYPGHCDLMRFLCNDLRLCKRRELFLDVLEHAVPVTEQDVVLIFVTVSGTRGGKLVQETFTKKVYHRDIGGEPMAAIQITTAGSVCAVLDLHREGVLPETGFLQQEHVPLDAFLANRFGSLYQSSSRTGASS